MFAAVTLPLAVPGLLVALIMSFLASFDEAQGTYLVGAPVFLHDADGDVLPRPQLPLSGGRGVSILLSISSVVLLLLVRRHVMGDGRRTDSARRRGRHPWRHQVLHAVAGEGAFLDDRPVTGPSGLRPSGLAGTVVLTEWARHRPGQECRSCSAAPAVSRRAGHNTSGVRRSAWGGLAAAVATHRRDGHAAAFDAGFGSMRGFYEQAGPRLGIEPARYAAGGTDEDLLWSTTDLAVGNSEPQALLAVVSRRGVVAVRIGPDPQPLLAEVAAELPLARLRRDDRALAEVMLALAALAEGASAPALPLDLRGTAFRAAVWAALRTIPAGETRSYGQVAESLLRPSAGRAVARACAANPAALVVPCHRVIRGDGELGAFRWSLAVKQALLDVEAQQVAVQPVIA